MDVKNKSLSFFTTLLVAVRCFGLIVYVFDPMTLFLLLCKSALILLLSIFLNFYLYCHLFAPTQLS